MTAQFKVAPLSSIPVDSATVTGLSRRMGVVKAGSSIELRSPFFEGMDVEELRSGWGKKLHTYDSRMVPTLQAMENSNSMKMGPRSVAVGWNEGRNATLADYFRGPGSAVVVQPLEDVHLFSVTPGRYRPLNPRNAVQTMVLSTNSGLPYLSRKRKVIESTLETFENQLAAQYPCVLFTRTQEGGKTRNVWGFPFCESIREMTFYRLLQPLERLLPWRAVLGGPDALAQKITTLISYAMRESLELISIDFSAYDASISAPLLELVMRKLLYPFQDGVEKQAVIDRMLNIGITTPEGVWSGPHGVPSGSVFTNPADSVAQWLIAKKAGFDGGCQIQGDDGVYAHQSPDEMFDAFRRYGLSPNESKTHVASNESVFLQQLYNPEYHDGGVLKPIYPTFRALTRIVFPERWIGLREESIAGRDYWNLRTISILENCKHHPAFSDLVKYVATHSKERLEPPSRESVAKIGELLAQSRGGLVHRTGDSLVGLQSFATVAILNKL